MKNFLSTHRLHLFLLSFIPLIIATNLFRMNFTFGGAEEGIPFFDIQRTLLMYSNIWVDQVPGYPLIFEVGKIPFLLFLLLISKVSSSIYIVSSVFVFTLMCLGSVGMYGFSLLLLKGNSNKNFIAFLAALFYLLNPFSMSQIWGRHLAMQIYPFALFPGFLALFIYGLQKKKFVYASIAVLFSAFLAGAFNHPSYVLSLFIVVFLYLLFYFLVNKNERLYLISYTIRTGIIFLLTNSFWLLPYIIQLRQPNNFIGNNENLSILMGLSKYFPLSTILTLKQKYYFNVTHTFGTNYDSIIFLAIALTFPLILILGFSKLKSLRKVESLFLGIGFLLALFICAGGNRPFGSLILWLMNHFSLLEVYRNTYEKFGLVLTLFYAILFGLGLYRVKLFLQHKKIALLYWLILYILFFIYVQPIWNGSAFIEVGTTNNPPHYYQNFIQWANNKEVEGRIMLTPILSGDATTQQWGDLQYRGVDISPYVLSNGTISRELPGTMGSEFTQELRKRIQQQDVSQILSALRVKYIVNRGDIVANHAFSKHIDFLTKDTYLVSKNTTSLCSNFKANKLTSNIFYSCVPLLTDFRNIKYLHVGIRTDTKVMIEIRLLDKNGLRSRWDGKSEKDYLIEPNTDELILPIGIETELPEKFLYSNVVAFEISYFPIDGYKKPSVFLDYVTYDNGTKLALNEYQLVKQFGMLDIYERKGEIFREIRSPQNIVPLLDIKTLFTSYKADVNKTYVVSNTNNSFANVDNQIESFEKISDTKYHIKLKNFDPAYILFGKSMNSNWKLVPLKLEKDFDIFKTSFVAETNHFVADGYANLWKVEGSSQYTLLYLPAVYVRIGKDISIVSILLIGTYLSFILIRNLKSKH